MFSRPEVGAQLLVPPTLVLPPLPPCHCPTCHTAARRGGLGTASLRCPPGGSQPLGTEDVGLLPTQHPLLRDALGHTVPNLQEKKQTWEQKDLPKILQSNLAQLGPPAFILTS